MPLPNVDRRSRQGFQKGSDGEAARAGFTGIQAEAVQTTARNLGVLLLTLPIKAYRWLISPWIGPRCRYLPTCSEYALDALTQHGALRGGWLAIRRLARCHPFGGEGFDPVPVPGQPCGCDRRRANEI